MLGSDVHTALPPHRCVNWYSFQHPESHVTEQALMDGLLPVEWHYSRSVYSDWFGGWANMELKWRAALQ